MKARCPECRKSFKAPDEWAGKRVRCPACKKAITLPDTRENDNLGLDLASLGRIETAGEVVEFERPRRALTLREAQAAAAVAERAPREVPTRRDPHLRMCPRCGQEVRVADIYTDVICKHCGAGIPGQEFDKGEKAKYTDGMAGRMSSKVSFYSGFTSAVTYPIPGITHILIAIGIGLGAIALPLGGILAFLAASQLNEQAARVDFGWVGPVMGIAFTIEGIYFSAVAYYLLIDTIRANTSGNESPPGLTWNVINLGAALGGYIILLVVYALLVSFLVMFNGGNFPPMSMADLERIMTPGNLMVLAVLTFGIPMNIIGLSSGTAMDGMHPAKVAKSIFNTIGHYTFLFLISLIAMGFFAGMMVALMKWAGPKMIAAIQQGVAEGVWEILFGLGAWAVVIGFAFYFAYAMGRILGLFARTYRESLEFEI